MVDVEKEEETDEQSPASKKKPRGQSRNAENHAALLIGLSNARRIVLFAELAALGVRYSRRHIDRLEAEKKFPRRIPLGEHRVGWLTVEIVAYVNRQIESRSHDAGTLGSRRVNQPAAPMLGAAATEAAKAAATTRRKTQPADTS